MKKIVILFFITSIVFATKCEKQLFNLFIVNPTPLSTILSDLVHRCGLNIVVKDNKAKKLLNETVSFINLNNVPLKELLDTVFQSAHLFYTLKANRLIVSYYKTEIFKIDFIPNSIQGVTNIDSNDNTVKTDYKFNFWDNLKNNIIQILKNVSRDYKDPIIDKNSGLVTVTGNVNQIEEVRKYINDLNNRLHKEVLIDVKIYSVTLSKSHKTGIDWSSLSLSLPNTDVPLRASNILGSNSVFNSTTFNIGAFVNFLAQFGNVNSVSNPKIVTLNNQKALIKVGNTIYYKYASSVTTDNNGNPTTSYTIGNKFVGVLLDITPQISDSGEIILNINPRISAFKDLTQLNSDRDMPPDTQENTMISVVKLKNNDTLVLGGLITDENNLRINGVPILKEIPVIKYLFSSKETITTKKELVFIITPHIIDLNKKRTLKDYGFGEKLPTLEDIDVR